MPKTTNRTHVENVKDPDKILIPSSNFVLIGFGEGESTYRIPFTMLDDLLLDLGQSSAIGKVRKWITLHAHYLPGSRSQPSDRIEDGPVELIQSSPLQFPVEYLAYIAASAPEIEEILIVGHRVLYGCESAVRQVHLEDSNLPESLSRGR